MQMYAWGPMLPGIKDEEPKTLSGQVLQRIRDDIIAGRIAPGTKLQVEHLKEHYGAGSSPLREALAQLAVTGLVSSEGQKGFRVAKVALRELVDVARLRLHLEVMALRVSLREGDVEWEIEISGAFRRLQHAIEKLSAGDSAAADRWEKAHRRFHLAIIGACGSPWTLHFCDRLYDQMERYRRIFVQHSEISPAILKEHRDILKASIERNEQKAVGLLEKHIVMAAYLTEGDMRAQGVHDAGGVPQDVRQLLHSTR